MNRRIRVPQVRVIGADGAQLGVLDTSEALRIAEEGGLDLVEVSPKAMPPVCKIMDYGKFKYEDSKKRKDAKKHQSTVTYKEIKFRPKTDAHDSRLQGEAHPSLLVGGQQGAPRRHLPRSRDRPPRDGAGDAQEGRRADAGHRDGGAAADDGRAAHADDHLAARRRHQSPGVAGARRRSRLALRRRVRRRVRPRAASARRSAPQPARPRAAAARQASSGQASQPTVSIKPPAK